MPWIDAAFLVLLAVVVPVTAARSYAVVMRAIALGEPGARRRAYRAAALSQWVLLALGLAAWFCRGRSAEALGLAVPSGAGAWVCGVIAAAAAALLTAQLRAVRRRPDRRLDARAELGGPLVFLPRHDAELPAWNVVSVTAGVVEEILYRGWMPGVLAPWIGLPAAIAASVAVFGMSHLYAGPGAAKKAAASGALFAAMVLLSGSVWIPVVLHAFVDVNAGLLSHAAFRASPDPRRAPSAA